MSDQGGEQLHPGREETSHLLPERVLAQAVMVLRNGASVVSVCLDLVQVTPEGFVGDRHRGSRGRPG